MNLKILLKEKTTSTETEQEQCLDVGLGLQQTEVATPRQSVQIHKSYKFRLYPNKEQTTALAKCPYCGIELDRDHNSAREIEHRGLVKHNLLPILSWNKGAVCVLRE